MNVCTFPMNRDFLFPNAGFAWRTRTWWRYWTKRRSSKWILSPAAPVLGAFSTCAPKYQLTLNATCTFSLKYIYTGTCNRYNYFSFLYNFFYLGYVTSG